MTNIGILKQVSPREAWKDEAKDFTPWLADHLEQLGEALGLPIEYEGHEVSVESFSADILARNPMNDARVLIENQLEKSDHKHVGQIMTYLAGLEAEIVIWIATDFTEPHRAAIKWLNEHTIEPYSFFAVKLKVVRISNSPLAPVFEVVERPNNWERQLQAKTRETQSRTKRADERTEFWAQFLEQHPEFEDLGMAANGKSSQWLAPNTAREMFLSVYLALGGVGVFLRGARGTSPGEFFERFEPTQDRFRELVSGEMKDASIDDHPATTITIDTTDRANWDEAIEWLYLKANLWLSAAETVFGEDDF